MDMSWTRVDDGFPWHRKLEPLMGNPRLWSDAVALLIAIWCDCTKRQTNGHVSGHRIDQLTPIRRTLKPTLKALVTCGFLEQIGNNYVVHDYLEYNGSREERAAKTRLKRERQRRWREKQKVLVDAPVDASLDDPGDNGGDAAPQPQPQPSNLKKEKEQKEKGQKASKEVREVFDCWRKVHKHPNARLDAKRINRINNRFDEGYSVAELCEAIEGAKYDTWLMGDNNNGKKYDGLHTILREAETVDRYRGVLEEHKNGTNGRSNTRSFTDNQGVLWTWDQSDGVYRDQNGKIHYGG